MLKKIINILNYVKCLILYFLAFLISLFNKNNPEYKDLWLIAERTTDARDNGYHFFKYLCEKKKNVNCAYVIDKNSPDFKKIKNMGRIIQPGSFEHYKAFVLSKVKISSHIMGYAPDSYRFAILDRKFNLVKGKKIFLQHGIIKDNISELHYPKAHPDLFVCSTIPEYESIIKDYNYPDGIVQRLGLCRFDNLLSEHEVKKQILVMPTWRYYLRPLSDDEFKKSQYYINFNGLLSDKRLHKLLEENGYELVLYLHYELQKFTHLFEGGNSRVKVKSMSGADVQQLLMESAMLITDYSSVFFDFAYMRKPLAYWTFDHELFFAEQYGKGYFVYGKDGFGPECSTKEEIIDYIECELKSGMKIDEKYAKRAQYHFSEFSTDHCEKTYEAILKLI